MKPNLKQLRRHIAYRELAKQLLITAMLLTGFVATVGALKSTKYTQRVIIVKEIK